MKKKVVPVAVVISVLLVTALSGALSGSEFRQIGVKADTETTYPDSNPVTLFEVQNEVQGEFGMGVFNEELEPKTDFQVGEEVSLVLTVRWLRGGTFPVIANLTTIRISNETGDTILSEVFRNLGGGWTAGTGGGYAMLVRWVPDAVGNYSAGVEFEGLIYNASDDHSNTISFMVHGPGTFVGKVTEADGTTTISDALVEALFNGVIKANATTDYGGVYNLKVEKAGYYDIRVSASGYVPAIRRCVSTELESKHVDFSLASTTLSPNFSVSWSAKVGNNRNVAVDSHGNVIVASESEAGTTVVSKFNASGNLLWEINRSFSGAWEVPRGLAVDSLDNILLLVGPNQFLCYNLWTVKLDPYGNHLWIKSFDSGETDQSTNIAVDSFDNVIIIGSVHGNLTSTLVKYTSRGILIWSKTLPIYFENGEIVVDRHNNIVLGGSTCSVSTGIDYYAAKLDSQGNMLWEKTFSTENNEYDYGYAVSLDSYGNIIVIGNKFTVKLGPDGSEIWLKYFAGKDLVVDLTDNIFSIRESFVEMFDRDGFFLGNIDLTEELSILAIDQNSTLIVGGTRNLVKMSLGGNSTTQSKDPETQPKTSTNSDLKSSQKNDSASISFEPTPMPNPEPTVLPRSSPESTPPPSQGTLIPEAQQKGETQPKIVLASISSIVSVSTVLLVYFKKRKR